MGFQSGAISFRAFKVIGTAPPTPDQTSIDAIAQHQFATTEVGAPEETEYGWSAGRHLYDQTFGFEANVFADCLFFAMRVDNNAVPGAVKKSYQAIEEAAFAAGNPSGFISKQQKREAKDIVARKVEQDMRDRKFRRSRVIPVLYDLANQTLYANANGKVLEYLGEIFERTFSCTLQPLDSGEMAARKWSGVTVDDLRPTRFVMGPEGDDQMPDYPWVAKGANPKNFLGNEFLLWLIWRSATGKLDTVFFDKSLELECAYGQTGRDVVKGDGPDKSPETREALRIGKIPRKAGVTFEFNRSLFTTVLAAESLSFGSLKLPDVEEAESARVLFEARIQLIRDFMAGIDRTFSSFALVRTAENWSEVAGEIGEWASAAVAV